MTTEDQSTEQTQELTAEEQATLNADAAAAFEDVFEPPKKGATPDDKTTETAAAVAALVEEPPVDEWEGVQPGVRKHIEAQAKQLEALNKIPDQMRNLAGHIGGLKSAMTAAQDAAKATAAAGTAAPDKDQIAAAGASGEKWKALKEDFPEWAEATDERFAAIAAQQAPKVDVESIRKEVGESATTAATTAAREIAREARTLAQVDIAHDGWEETVNSAAFGDWLKGQPPAVRALGESSKPKDAIKMLDGFKADQKTAADKAAAAAKNKQRLAGAAPVKSAHHADPRYLPDKEAEERGFLSAFE